MCSSVHHPQLHVLTECAPPYLVPAASQIRGDERHRGQPVVNNSVQYISAVNDGAAVDNGIPVLVQHIERVEITLRVVADHKLQHGVPNAALKLLREPSLGSNWQVGQL